MIPLSPDQGRDKNPASDRGAIADELKRMSERLRQLAEDLQAREEALAEMQANYPHFKRIVYAMLREKYERELPPLPDMDLVAFAAQEGSQPLETFIEELEGESKGADTRGTTPFTAEEIQARLWERPFRPLRIVTSEGQQFDVLVTDLVSVGRHDLMIGTPDPASPSIYERMIRVPLVNVVALEDLPVPPSPSVNDPSA